MEPPAKRMRILQSIGVDEVDESNPDYIRGKQQNGEWLKNKFEAIYAKFEAMPDMMSDEVDMRGEGAIVVDRGHMRKLDKEYRNRLGRRRTVMPDRSQLIDDMFANDKEMEMDDEDEIDERDELAPSQSPEPVLQKATTEQHVAPIARLTGQTDIPVPNTPANATLQATLAASVNHTADVLQLVQFPQTPAGQQARQAFEAHTTQAVNQAVNQAVASIFSSFLSTVPTFQSPQLGLFKLPETPAAPVKTREVAPATAPSLYRPPPPVVSDPPAISRSSPVPVQAERRKRRSFAVGVHVKPSRHESIREGVPLFVDQNTTQLPEADASEPSANNNSSNMNLPVRDFQLERSEKPRRGKCTKYVFTAEDDQYIIESRVLHKRPWAEIMDSKPKWRKWNKSSFWQRWCNKLREQATKMERSGELASLRARANAGGELKVSSSMNERPVTQAQSSPVVRHLPTPSSLENDEAKQSDDEPDLQDPEDLIASGGHFDDDEKDLLSLCDDGPTGNIEADPLGSGDTDSYLADAREIPETPLNLTQETSSQPVFQGTVTREGTIDVVSNSQTTHVAPKSDSKSKPATAASPPHASSSKTKKPSPKSRSNPTAHTCPLCRQTFPTAALLATHTTYPHPREIHISIASSPLPAATPPNVPPTPAIKREPFSDNELDMDSTPTKTNPLLSTPIPVPHPSSSTASKSTPKSTGKLSRADYNAVKRAWARGGGRGATPGKGKRKRQSLGTASMAPRKRSWDDAAGGEGSADELGM
ncbi:uncharacterized protein CC84DRAFT_1169693 [Paraphaeosphaeria sporulosa]|uniref:C2H2-type domain-containing protein n=1 Tax=Paraphaeosphaeria sporulosa TaxID=1460663 RepID=A0A177BX61_9PLEO|nr:uncharacterized protein CC84DRAFT_1169693 [Paraphaeosphaeria sporulosa]OAF98966.1 hypothetical protein CC84DRAFT_1169693 [Paraphaeosphaeria sporulosa]